MGFVGQTFIPWRDVQDEWMRDPEYRRLRELHRLPEDVSLAFIAGRLNLDMTQQQVAERMGTTQSVVARMENGRHLPSLRSIERYAKALGLKLEIKLVPAN